MKRNHFIVIVTFLVLGLGAGCAYNNSAITVTPALDTNGPVVVNQKANTSSTEKATKVQANSNDINVAR